jgi:hypothetical protein
LRGMWVQIFQFGCSDNLQCYFYSFSMKLV